MKKICTSFCCLTVRYCSKLCLTPLNPNGDENEISLKIITTCSNNQVMRMKKVITKHEMS